MFPEVAAVVKLTVMELVLLPEMMVAPGGMVHKYPSAPGMAGTEYMMLFAGVQIMGLPLMGPAVAGVVPTSTQVVTDTV